MKGDEVIYKKCDIFVPAAFEKSINMSNANKFQCKVVIEAANGPTTMSAEEIMVKRGIHFFPDVLMNAGGVTVSYFEWLKNLDHTRPGRLTKKWEEKSKINLLKAVEKLTGQKMKDIGPEESALLAGPSELDMVRSGL